MLVDLIGHYICDIAMFVITFILLLSYIGDGC